MGYFSNGTEGMIYQEHYCEKCVHWNEEHGCPCWNAHEIWNYDECNNRASVLHRMIPRDGVENGRCVFHVPNAHPHGRAVARTVQGVVGSLDQEDKA